MADDKLSKIIKQAIMNENEGYEFYKLAADKFTAKEAQEAFLQLAEEEKLHLNWLKGLIQGIKENKDLVDLDEVSPPASPEVFNWENAPVQQASMALSVFGIAVRMEKNSIEFYQQAQEDTTESRAKELFARLIDWEYQHLEAFQKQYEQLQREWWHEQRFEPF